MRLTTVPLSSYKLEKEICIEVTCVNVTCPVHASCSLSENQPHCFCDKTFVAQGAFCRSDIACEVDAKASGCPTNEFCKQVIIQGRGEISGFEFKCIFSQPRQHELVGRY